MRLTEIVPEFVDEIPEVLEHGKIYVSEKFRTASHLCPCGCQMKVVTPFGKFGWILSRGEGKVTLAPSIGNWQYACRSHYWITFNQIVWC